MESTLVERKCSNIRVVDDNVVFASGQLDIDESGVINHAGDLYAQSIGVIDRLKSNLAQADASLNELVKLVVFYVQHNVDEPQFRQHLGQTLARETVSDAKTAVTFVPLHQLSHAGALVEIEAIAIRNRDPEDVIEIGALADAGPGFCHGIRCGTHAFVSGQCAASREHPVLYPGDLVSQNQKTIENIQLVTQAMEVEETEIVKVNSWRAPAPEPDAYQRAAYDRFRFLAPSAPTVTGITIPRLHTIGFQIRLDLWAMDSTLVRTRINPADHWGWKIKTSYSHGLKVGDWLFVGGQAALDQDCNVQYPDDPFKQLDVTRQFINNVLRDAQGEHDIVRINGMFCDTFAADVRSK